MKLIIFQQGGTNFEVDIPDNEDVSLLKEMINVLYVSFVYLLNL